MIVGNYNFHQMLFALDTFQGIDEKVEYLENIKSDLNRIATCFEATLTLPLQTFSSQVNYVEEGCDELNDFIKQLYPTLVK